MRPTTCPSSSVRDTSFSAWIAPKFFETSINWRTDTGDHLLRANPG
jgi:hypothetical protein